MFAQFTPSFRLSRSEIRMLAHSIVAFALVASTRLGSGFSPDSATPKAPTIRVCGIDRSGSVFPLVRIGLRVCAREIAAAGPGDQIIVRWISSRSFTTDAEILRVTLPSGGSACPNPFAQACRRRLARTQEALAAAKHAAVKRLLAQKPRSSGSTDLGGFIQAAGDLLSAAPPGMERRLTIASDLEDTARQLPAASLAGTGVRLALLTTSNDVAKAVSVRAKWISRLKAMGATTVEVFVPGSN